MSPTNLSEYYTGKGQALPSVSARSADAAAAGITGNYTGTADQNNQLLSYYLSQKVPTKAPVAVVGAGPATSLINDKIVPTMNDANARIAASQLPAQMPTPNQPTQTPQTTAPTPEQQIANQPEPGMKWIYDKATGDQQQIPLASPVPQTHTTVDVKNAAPVETTYSTDGNITFKKLADGTYGQYDTKSGQYLGASNENQFNTIKTGQAAKTAYENAVNNGALLNDSQKAQIKAISDTYQNLLNEQSKANANYTGGMSVAQNLYGIGNTVMGLGAIKGAADEGAAKIADITSKMNSDIAKMTAAFQSDNLKALKDAYDSFSANSASLQKAIDTQHAEATQLARDQRQQTATAQAQVDNNIRGLLDTATKAMAPPAILDAMQKAAANHDYAGVAKAGGDYLASATGTAGEYFTYVRDAKSRGIAPMSFDQYQTADANRKARVAAAGAANGYSPQAMTKVMSIANNFDNEQSVKNYQVVSEGKQFMDNISSDTTNPADQQGIIYAFAKIMDPNSVVREGEYATVQKYAQSWADQFGFKVERIFSNSPFLTKEAINNMKATVASKASASEANYKNIYNEYGRRINKVTGGGDGVDYITDYSKGFNSVGNQHIQDVAAQREGLKTFISSSPNNATIVNALRQKYPAATPEQIYSKLKERNIIK